MQLFTPQEIHAMTALLNRTPMTAAEQLYAQWFFQRLVAFCQPSEPGPEPEPRPGPESNTPTNEEVS